MIVWIWAKLLDFVYEYNISYEFYWNNWCASSDTAV